MKNKIVNDTFLMNLASIISQGLLILQGFIVLRFVDPASYGVWMGLLILLRYGSYAHLGLSFGLMFRLPYYTGQQDLSRARQVEDTTFFGWLLLTFLFAFGVLGYYLIFADSTGVPALGAIIISIMFLTEEQSGFMNRWNTNARKDFKLFSIISIIRSFLSFFIVVSLTYFFQLTGLMLGSLLVSAGVALLWWFRTPFRPRLNFSLPILVELFRVGFPNLLVVLGYALIETIDRVLVLNLLGPVYLGYYAVTNMGGSSLYGLMAQAASVTLPHMVEETDQYRNNYGIFEKYMIKPSIYYAYLAALMVIFLVFAIPSLVDVWLPKYVPGLLAFYLFVPGFFFLGINIFASNILNVILVARNRTYWLVVIQFLAVCVEVLCGLIFIRAGWGIAGVGLASTLSYMVYSFVVLFFTSRFVIQNHYERRRLFLELILPFVYGAILVLTFLYLGQRIFPDHPLVRGFSQLIFSVACFLPLLFRLDKRYSLFTEVRSISYISRLSSWFRRLKGNN